MTFSGKNLANQNRKWLSALSEFANMGDSTECWRAFLKRWPALFPPKLYTESEAALNAEPAASTLGSKPWTIVQTWKEESRQYTAVDGKTVYDDVPEILRLRNLLRDAWRGGPTANQSVADLMGLHSEVLSVYSDWQRASIVFLPRNEMQAACYALLLHSNRARFCANPDCPAPYFIAKRTTQRYCSPDCLKPFQKQWKLDWWNREGKARRAKASAKSRKGGKNVTRKTR
jgi:hypothetical protein